MNLTSKTENGTRMDFINFSYDWYYTADYSIKFTNQIHKYQVNEVAFLYLTYDDHDNARADDVMFQCTRTR